MKKTLFLLLLAGLYTSGLWACTNVIDQQQREQTKQFSVIEQGK